MASCNEGEWNYQYLGILQNAEELISSDINWNGYSLLRYRNFIRIADNQGRWNTIYATTTNAYFSDYDVLRVFLDSPGICREVTPEGELCWQKTTAFIKPEFFARTDNSIIIRTSIPGQQRVLFFEKKNSEEVFHLLDETSTANNLPHDSNGNSIPEEVLVRGKSASSFYEGKDRLGYKYNRQKDGTLLVVSPDNKQQEMIYGSACVFNGTVFSEISLAGVPLKNTPHIPAIQQYGGIVKEDLPDDRN